MKLFTSQRKRFISFVLAFALIISIFSIMPLSVSASVGDVFTVDSLTYTVTADNEVKISGFDRVSTEVVIDEKVNYEDVDYAITAIDAKTAVFRSCTSLEKITFNNSSLSIASMTFRNATSLKEVYIKSDIEFRDNALLGTTNLENVYCYSANIVFGEESFPTIENNPTLKFYGYDESSAETYANSRGYAFESLGEVPSTEPSTNATEHATDATEPEETTVPLPVGESFTVGSLTYTVTADNEVKISGFDRVSTEVVIDEKVKYEGVDYAITAIDAKTAVFRSCTSLEKITFNNSSLSIASMTFRNATSLKEVYIKADIEFRDNSLLGTTNLENVYCYSANIVFGEESFPTIENNPNLRFYGYDGSSAETYANSRGYAFESLGEVPSTEPSTNATEPSTDATEPSTDPDDGLIFTWQTIDDGTAVEITGFKPEYKYTYDVVIPSEINGLPVTSIGYNAFYGSSIFTLEIPSSVKVISERAFGRCGYLKTVTFAEDSQLEIIGNEAFYRVQGQSDVLNEIVLPASLKQIGYRAFYNRHNLLTVKVLSKDVIFGDPEKGKEIFDFYVPEESNLRLYGYTDSTTEAYAAEAGHKFRYLDLNTEELQALYDKAEAIDASLYTKESYDALAAQMKAAKRMIANRDATPQMVNDCIKELQAAIDGLVEYVEPTTTAPETTVEPDTTEPETTVPVEYIEYVLGDVDGTEGISIDDATAIQMHAAELVELKGADLFAANINDDENIDIQDVTLIQMWIAEYEEAMAYKIGEKFVKEVVPTQPTEPLPTDPQPTGPDEETFTFYLPNYVSWLTDMGGKMWIYNNETEEFLLLEYDGDEELFFYDDLPVSWTDIGLYRTPYETTEEEFDIHDDWNEEAQTGVILNKWENLGDRGDNNCFKITGDGEGFYTMYDPDDNQDDERTIYFDNSNTQWSAVYIYGWSFGIYQEFIPLENEGNDIWSYTFYDELPVDGVKGFLFVDQPSWSGATQTNDLATEEGKNIFVPTPGGQKLNGKWDVYNP